VKPTATALERVRRCRPQRFSAPFFQKDSYLHLACSRSQMPRSKRGTSGPLPPGDPAANSISPCLAAPQLPRLPGSPGMGALAGPPSRPGRQSRQPGDRPRTGPGPGCPGGEATQPPASSSPSCSCPAANAFSSLSAKRRAAVNSAINSPGGRGLAGEAEGRAQSRNGSGEDALLSQGILLPTFAISLTRDAPAKDPRRRRAAPAPAEEVFRPPAAGRSTRAPRSRRCGPAG